MECILFKEESTTYVLPMLAVAHVSRLEQASDYLPWQNYSIPIVYMDENAAKNITFVKTKVAVINALFEDTTLFPYFALMLGDNFLILDIQENEITWSKKEDHVTIQCQYRAPFDAKLINLMALSKQIELEITH